MDTCFHPVLSIPLHTSAWRWHLGIWRILLLFCLLLLTLPLAVRAQFTYTTNNATITITGYRCTAGEVAIPSVINGLPVTSIGNYAFHGCTGLTRITIPSSVTSFETAAFAECSSLRAIEVEALNPVFSSLEGVLLNRDRTILYRCPEGRIGGYTIPRDVTSIASEAFSGCTGLTNITIPNSVTSIRSYAFFGCTMLTSVTIGTGVTYIHLTAFTGCTELREIEVNALNPKFSGLGGALYNRDGTSLILCSSGRTGGYTIPHGVTSIGPSAFYGCTGLTNITLPNSVRSIRQMAFYGCAGLTSFTIPNSVTSVEDAAFRGCTGLASVTIGNGVTYIANEAFAGCTGLTSVTIPKSVRVIRPQAFAGCTRLSGVYSRGDAPLISVFGVFDGADGVTVYYLPGASGWKQTIGGRPTAVWSSPLLSADNSAFGVGDDGFGFGVSWAPNATFVVESATDIARPVWLPLATNTPPSGTFRFTDPNWKDHPQRVYRVRTP